jgi:protoporphyrinogen oxidase
VESAQGAGGLVRGVEVGGEPVEAFYHHVFPQDVELRDLMGRLGCGDDLECVAALVGRRSNLPAEAIIGILTLPAVAEEEGRTWFG